MQTKTSRATRSTDENELLANVDILLRVAREHDGINILGWQQGK